MPANLGTAYVTIMPSAKGISGSITNAISGEATSAGTTAGHNLIGSLKKVIVAAGIGKFFKDALEAGGALQQSFGGLETIYGDAAAGMKDLAYEAAKAGISANSYAEQAVSFGASLKQAYGGDMVAAANAANTAILDMADNSAKMGTDIASIQNAYQGFAKQNYTMLDNLKLGYGGTKTEMQRLLADAEKLSGVHYDIENLGDVYQAVHVIQEEIGLTGVAAAEAEGTFTGSMQSMKAAWENLKANLATGGDVTESLMIVYQSARNFVLNNLLPMIGNVLKGLPTLVSTALQQAFTDIPSLFDMVKKFVDDISGALITQRGTFTDGFVELINGAFDMVENIDWMGLGMSIINMIINGIRAAGEALLAGVQTIGERAAEMLRGIDWANLGQNLIDALKRGLDTGSGLFTEAFRIIGETAWQIVSSIDWIELGKAIIRLIIEGNLAVAETYFNTMKTIGQTAWEWMKSVDWKALGQTIITTIGTALRNAGSTIWQGLKNVGQTAWNWFRNIDWAGLGKQVLTAILTGIFTAALALYQGVKQIATQAVTTFKNTDWAGLGRQVLTSIGNGIRAVASNLWNALRSAATSAWNTVTTIDWRSLGTNIINGIINGIRGAGQALINALTGCARTAWQNAKNFLGIKSPSTLFRDTVGKFIPLGMAEGIEDEAGAVTDALNGIARDSVATIDTDLNVRAATSEALDEIEPSDPIVVNVYPSQGMDEKRLADLVSRRLALAERQRMAARGMA